MLKQPKEFSQTFFHGTKFNFEHGDLIDPGFDSNYLDGHRDKYVYFTSNLNVAAWGAELAKGEGSVRIYVVEPNGNIEDDPNVTDKKFPGNPTNSYRTEGTLSVVGEVKNWKGHTKEEIKARKDSIEKIFHDGGIIE